MRAIDGDALRRKIQQIAFHGNGGILTVQAINEAPTLDVIPIDDSICKISREDFIVYKRSWLYEHLEQEFEQLKKVRRWEGEERMTKDEAIEMLKHCGAESHCFDYKHRNCGGCNQRKAQDMAIEALKTEAIPIEWLKEWAKKEDNFFGGILYASLISTILTDWQLRKEE